LYILYFYIQIVYNALGEISFFPEGQRAEIFEMMDNEVPIFRITLPGNEFYSLKRAANSKIPLDMINDQIKDIINSINHQNLTKLFPEYNFSELLPELPLKDDGYPNIDETKFLLSYQEYLKLSKKYDNSDEIIFNIFKDNEYLNLIKVIYMFQNELRFSDIETDLWDKINLFQDTVVMDDDGNFFYYEFNFIRKIKTIVDSINEVNFNEMFPDYNFTEILPELPMNENGHPNIDYKKYIISDDKYRTLEDECNGYIEILFNIFNNNDYLNLIKVFYIVSNLNTSTTLYDERIREYIQIYRNHVIKDEENFIYIDEYYIQMIKNVVDSLNEQNFYEIFPGYNFTEILPELPMKENGHPNIDFKKYIISDDEYFYLRMECESNTEILFNIFNNNKYLNLIKVFYTLSNLNVSTKKDNEMWDTINLYLKYVHKDDNGKFSYRNTDYIYNIKEIVNSLNEQNFYEIFPGYNFTEILPELPMNENGHPNIDYNKYIISDDEYRNLKEECKKNIISDDEYQNLKEECNNDTEILINIFNNNEYLNLLKVFHTLYNLNVSTKNDNDEIWYNIKSFENSIELDDNGNFKYKNESYILTIKGIVDSINKVNFNEIFPGYNFTKILPELPMKENGYPNIDYKKYIISDDEYRNLEDEYKNNEEILFSIFNNNKYLNLINVFYTLYNLEIFSRSFDDIWDYIYKFGSKACMDSDGNFIYLKYAGFIEIKEIIDYVNKQNFTEIFPGINFSEILPELPMNENGHPSIDFKKCIEYNSNFLSNEDNDIDMSFNKYLFEFFNNNEYLNLIKIFYTLSHLYESSFSSGEINDFIREINYYTEDVYLNENGDLVYKMDDMESDFYISKENDYIRKQNTSYLIKHIDNYKFKKTKSEEEIKDNNEFKTKNATMIVEINK